MLELDYMYGGDETPCQFTILEEKMSSLPIRQRQAEKRLSLGLDDVQTVETHFSGDVTIELHGAVTKTAIPDTEFFENAYLIGCLVKVST